MIAGLAADTVWRHVIGYEGMYEVSSAGLIRSITRVVEVNSSWSTALIRRTYKGKLISCGIGKLGYVHVKLYKNGKYKTASVHRLVAEAFHPNPCNKATVNHINEAKYDNRAENLEWMTHQENTQHSIHK